MEVVHRRLVGVSTKMYFSAARTRAFVDEVRRLLFPTPGEVSPDSAERNVAPNLADIDIFILPDHITLTSVVAQVRDTPLLVGAQDAAWDDTGALTGEVSPAVLREVGCHIVEVGHAERRRLFGETDEIVARKALGAIRNGLVPLICVGETTKPFTDEMPASADTDYDMKIQAAVVECAAQISAAMMSLPEDAEVILAYEPVWAIGASQPADAKHVRAVVGSIRKMSIFNERRGVTRILYGGSAGPGLFTKLKGYEGVDGLFLGRYAHDPKEFLESIREVVFA